MTLTVYPLDAVSGAPLYTGQTTRQAISALCGYAPAGRPLGAVSGVRPGTPSTTVTVSGSTATIGPHSGILDVETPAAAGPYLYANDANVTKTVNAADATNPRIDLISIRLDDPAESDGTSVPLGAFVYTAGTAASSPSAPATPARSLALATILVPALGGGASTVTWIATAWNQTVRHYLTNTSGQTIPDTTTTTVTGWTTVESAGMGAYSTGVRTIAVAGEYDQVVKITYPTISPATGVLRASLIVNGVEVDVTRGRPDVGIPIDLQLAVTMGLNIGDTVYVSTSQSTGSGQALATAAGNCHWSLTRVGPL